MLHAARLIAFVVLLAPSLPSAAEPSEESLSSVHLLMERVVEVMTWDLLEPGIDPEVLPLSSDSAAQTWPAAAKLLDDNEAQLDNFCAYLSADRSSIHQAHARRVARVFRADIARAIELGDTERAARRLAGMLDAARHLMRPDRLLIDRIIGYSILQMVFETIDETGTEQYDDDTVRPTLDRLSHAELGWLTMSAHQQRIGEEKEKLASLFAAFEVDARDSLQTPNVLPAAFEGTWTGDLTVYHGEDRVYPRVRLSIERAPENPKLVTVEYIAANQGSDWFERSHPGVATRWSDGTPEVEHRDVFQREDRASDIWVRVVERDTDDGTRLEPVHNAHLTLFAGRRLELVDLTPMGLSSSGWIMSIQLTDDGTMDFEMRTLEAREITAMPAAKGLWAGRLQRSD